MTLQGHARSSASRSTQPSIPPGSVNEYQLQLGRQRQVWLIPIADECVGVQVKLWNPSRTRAIPEHFCGGDSLRRGTISSVCTFTFWHDSMILRYCFIITRYLYNYSRILHTCLYLSIKVRVIPSNFATIFILETQNDGELGSEKYDNFSHFDGTDEHDRRADRHTCHGKHCTKTAVMSLRKNVTTPQFQKELHASAVRYKAAAANFQPAAPSSKILFCHKCQLHVVSSVRAQSIQDLSDTSTQFTYNYSFSSCDSVVKYFHLGDPRWLLLRVLSRMASKTAPV